MAIHPIRVVGDPVLSTPTRPVTDFDDTLRALVADMYETMAAANGVGLAANQIGVDLRVFVYDCPDDDFEGCLSVPGETYPTGRATSAKVTGFDDNGEPVEVEGAGFFARCLQHETDHLDGLLYLDRLVGRNARAAKKMLKHNGWGIPGLSWDPAVEPDPFADEDDDEV